MEYVSPVRILGVPLLHVCTGTVSPTGYRRGVARGWIALGNIAIGILASFGGLAIGGVSVGGISIGLLPIGGCAIGAVALGGLSLAWQLALGGVAVAHEYAAGGVAIAAHVVSGYSPQILPRHPEAPFRVEDALWLVGFVAALFLVVRRLEERRQD
jgi:hypothetical protein